MNLKKEKIFINKMKFLEKIKAAKTSKKKNKPKKLLKI